MEQPEPTRHQNFYRYLKLILLFLPFIFKFLIPKLLIKIKEQIEFVIDLLTPIENEIDNSNNDNNNKKITMIYKINKKNRKIRILGENFVKRNKRNCQLIINNKKYVLRDCIEYSKYNINTNDDLLIISLIGINNITNTSEMFCHSEELQSLPDISKWDTQNTTDISQMFSDCSSLQSLPDISKWDIKNVSNMKNMFNGCKSTLSIPSKFKSSWSIKNK